MSVWPPREDGTKAPVGSWKPGTVQPAESEQIKQWYEVERRSGVGIICGAVSGNLECLDFDTNEAAEEFATLATEAGLADLIKRIQDGWWDLTPSGHHLHWRCEVIEGNQKLAFTANGEAKLETRGEGGYIICGGTSGAVHPSGNPYTIASGGPATVATITPAERESILQAARALNDMPAKEAAAPPTMVAVGDGLKPGADFNARADGEDELRKHGWQLKYVRGDDAFYCRPGKDRGISGVYHRDTGMFVNFSTSTPFETERGYGKFSVYAILNHDGDFKKAARELADKGFGSRTSGSQSGTGQSNEAGAQGLELVTDEWSMPGSLESASLPEFPAGVFPSKVEAFIAGLAEATETPRALSASVVLGGISAAARNLFQIQVRPGYVEQTNLWIVPFMPSGNRKSPVFAEVIAPLLDWEHQKARQDRIDRSHWQAQRDMEEIELKELKNSAAKGKEGRSSKDDRLKAMALQEKFDTEKKPKITKLIADDITPEKAVTVLDEQDGVLAVMSAEGASLLANAGGRYNGGIPNLDNLLKGHSGDTIVVDRNSREGEHIRRPYLTITVSPQPAVARTWGEMESFVQRGGAARILACFPASNVGFRSLINRPMPDHIRDGWGHLLTTILDLTPPQGGDADGHRIPCRLVVGSVAMTAWEAFAHEIEAMLRPGGELESLEGWGSKAPGAAARIAGLIHIAAMAEIQLKPEDYEIGVESMDSAIQIMRFFVAHAKTFYDHLNGFGDQSAERALWDVIRTMNGPITKRALFRKARSNRFRRAADIESPLSRLEELDYVRITRQKHEGGKGGRPTDVIEINPYAQGQNRQYPESEAA